MNLEKLKETLKEHIAVYAQTLPKGSGYTGDQSLKYLSPEESVIALDYGIPLGVRAIYCDYHGSKKDMFEYVTVKDKNHLDTLLSDISMESRATLHCYLDESIQDKLSELLSEAISTEQKMMSANEPTVEEVCAENELYRYEDLPVCIKIFYDLNQHYQGKPLDFAEWVRAAHEINMDFFERTRDISEQIADSIKEAETQYGYHVAKAVYDSQTVILPNEIIEASKYIAVGGDIDDIPMHANNGHFMDVKSIDEMQAFVNSQQTNFSPTMTM